MCNKLKDCLNCIYKVTDEYSDVVYCGETNKVIIDYKTGEGDLRTCDKFLERSKPEKIKSYEDKPIF